MRRSISISFLVLLLFPTYLLAQLTISTEIRPRSEYRHGFKSLASTNQDPAIFIDQRARLNLNFVSNKTEVFLSLQDIRTWGNQPQLVVDNGQATGVHQAWAKIGLNKLWATKIGRQELSYDDHRILGNVEWAQQARSHDAALLIYHDSTFTGHFGMAFNQDKPQLIGTNYSIPNNYKAMQFVWLHKNWNSVKGSLLFLNNGIQVNFRDGSYQTNFSQTFGGRLVYSKNRFSSNLSFYYQSGINPDTLNRNIKAYYLAFDATYRLEKNIALAAGIEILSGNDQLESNGKNNSFTPFYGTNHKFNGLMDYFYVGNHIGSVGLNDFFVKAIYKKDNFNASLVGHYFLANANISNPMDIETVADPYLGSEVDFTLGWKFMPNAALNMGYSQMFGSPSMEILKGGDRSAISNWGWLMITIKPSFTFKND